MWTNQNLGMSFYPKTNFCMGLGIKPHHGPKLWETIVCSLDKPNSIQNWMWVVRLNLVYTTVVQVSYIWWNTDYSSTVKL